MPGRTWVWRVTAGLAAVAVCGLCVLAAPGSVTVVTHAPAGAGRAAQATPRWARTCLGERERPDHPQVAFCARVDGRVVDSSTESGSGETHLLVLGRFHMIIVELPPGARRPGWGSHITAVGALARARDGQRELVAVSVQGV